MGKQAAAALGTERIQAMPAALRQAVGVERADGAADYFDPEWLRAHPRPDMVGN